MTEILLSRTLCDLISEAIKDLNLPCPEGDVTVPRVFNGFVKFPQQEADGFPFVLVRPILSTSDENSTSVEVGISICAYYELKDDGEYVDGYEEAMNVASRIRNALFDLPNGCLAECYVLSLPIRIVVGEEQAHPYWQVDMTTSWTFRVPEVTNWSEE